MPSPPRSSKPSRLQAVGDNVQRPSDFDRFVTEGPMRPYASAPYPFTGDAAPISARQRALSHTGAATYGEDALDCQTHTGATLP